MLEWSTKHGTAATIIELMKEANLCRANIKRKEFNKTENNTYTAIGKKVHQLVIAKYINEISDTSGVIGSGRRKFYSLTESGKDFVERLDSF